jgi:hypothetical protein
MKKRVDPIAFARAADAKATWTHKHAISDEQWAANEAAAKARELERDAEEREERRATAQNNSSDDLEWILPEIERRLRDWGAQFSKICGFPDGRVPAYLARQYLDQPPRALFDRGALTAEAAETHDSLNRCFFDEESVQLMAGDGDEWDPLAVRALLMPYVSKDSAEINAGSLGISRRTYYRYRDAMLRKFATWTGGW